MRATIQAVQPWATPVAILLGAGIIGGSFFLTNQSRFAISAMPSESATAVWRIDTWTGEVRLCTYLPVRPDPLDPFAKYVPGVRVKILCQEELVRPN